MAIWSKLERMVFNAPPRKYALEDVTIITWNSKKPKGILERNLDRLSVPYWVMGKGTKGWVNRLKVKFTNDALSRVKTRYVIGMDSFDVMVLDDPNEAVRRFEQHDCGLLFNAEYSPFPKIASLNNFEKSIGGAAHYKYLNAGAWIGKTDFCREFFAEAAKVKTAPPCSFSDQKLIRTVHKDFYPWSKVDYGCTIFQVLQYIPAKINYINLDVKLG